MAMPRDVLIGLVKAYRLALSPWLGNACRFEPTCSAYAIGALQQHGAAVGSYLTLRRLARCHPWCPGGADAVPAQAPRLFSWPGAVRQAPVSSRPPPNSEFPRS
jgi:putative membrane protein insertion efficiency factor